MPLLIAPVFNSASPKPVALRLDGPFTLVSGNEQLYQMSQRFLQNAMNENRLHFAKKVSVDSMFLCAQYPRMKVTNDDRAYIQEIENKLNLAAQTGVCSIPYVITFEQPHYGITYLKRSLEGEQLVFAGQTEETFRQLITAQGEFPALAYSRYLSSLEKDSYEDRLLDLWIALESLFVPDGKKGEITYKLRLRMAFYFGGTLQERQRLADFIKTSYNHRSEIVHSGKQLGNRLKGEVLLLSRIARAALLNMYAEGIGVKQLQARLDESVLAGQGYRERYQPPRFESVNW